MSSISQILIVGHTHHDVGYTNSPRIIDPLHARIVGEVLDLADRYGGEGPDAFTWTFEVARPVLRFLAEASPADRERLRAHSEAGRIAVTGGYLNMTQLPSEYELDAAYDALSSIRDAGIDVRTQQHGDVNGIAWGTVEAMRRAGLDRLVMALNPDHGRAPFEQPSAFWWESPAGQRVFVLLSTHYGFGEEWGIVDGDVDLAVASIESFVARLDERPDYPFDTALVHAANDNRWPTAKYLAVVREWNRRHPDLPMRTATLDTALDVLVAQSGDVALPVVRGEWSDWWAHGHGSTAREVSVYREARSFARVAETHAALAILAGDPDPRTAEVLGYRRGPVLARSQDALVDDLRRVDEQLLLFGEHTWGSWETYSKPHSVFSHSHWNAKAGFAYSAYDLARDLAVESFHRRAAVGADAPATETTPGSVLVLNPMNHRRREAIELEVAKSRRATVIADVPAFGSVLLPPPATASVPVDSTVAQSERFRALVDPARGGLISLVDRHDDRELLDVGDGPGLGALIVERIPAGSTHPMVVDDPKNFSPEHPGPDFDRSVATGAGGARVVEADGWTRIEWSTRWAGLAEVNHALTLYDELDTIDLTVTVDKVASFEAESLFVTFPFAVDDPRFLLETAGAVYAADEEQLPNSSRDWFSIQHAIGVAAGAGVGHGMLWGSLDAPLVQVGGIHTGLWAERMSVTGGVINSWLMNNLHFTNFQASQGGTTRFRYRFLPVKGVRPRDVRRFGRELGEPLQARVWDDAAPADVGVSVTPARTVIAELRPVGDGQVRARLRNTTGDAVEASVEAPGGISHQVSLGPHGVADVALVAPAG
jgi:alpha-mannosidase